MKFKLTLILLLLVVVPLSLLTYLGWRVTETEQERNRQKYIEGLELQLEPIRASIGQFMEERRRAAAQIARSQELTRESLVLARRNYPFVSQLFHLDPDGNLVYPNPKDDLSDREKAFLQRTEDIWRNKSIPSAAAQDSAPPGDSLVKGVRRLTKQSSQMPASNDEGWYIWFMGNGLNFIYWTRTVSGDIVGVELNRPRLIADVISLLPETKAESPQPADGSIRLKDVLGNTLYQWGGHETAEQEKAAVSISLGSPLSAWSLDYYVSPEAYVNSSRKALFYSFLPGLLAVALVIAGLAIYLHRETSREMREASQRVNFVNQVSHELKTPLTNIQMYAELLENEIPEDEEKAASHLRIIVTESQRLGRLIGNILTFGRKQRSALSIHRNQSVVDEVIREVLGDFKPGFDKKGIEVQFDAGASLPVTFDADVLKQILGNLFSNVEKYAYSGRAMKVVSSLEDGMAEIIVSDNGPGIPDRDRRRVFAPFYRVSNKLTDGVAGTGIGLAISRDLARLHGGDLVLMPGKTGAAFRITLKTGEAQRP